MNVVLIGMPGCGKSTVGIVLAKILGYGFVDTDLVLQNREGMLLHEYLANYGFEGFVAAEGRALCSVVCDRTVIATGGSAVYSESAMKKLKENAVCAYLYVPENELCNRLGDLSERGVAGADTKSLHELFLERAPLYERFADIRYECVGDISSNAKRLAKMISEFCAE